MTSLTHLTVVVGVALMLAAAGWRLAPRALSPSRRPSPSAPTPRRRWRLHAVTVQRRPRQAPAGGVSADQLEQVARVIRSGSSIAAAIGQVAADHPASVLRSIDDRRAAGASLRDAVASTPSTTPDDRLVMAVLSAVVDGGGPGADATDRAAATLRERADARAERLAQAAQARLSAQIMSFLPVGFTAWGVATDARTARFVLGSPAGLLCLGAGVALDVLGWRWMSRIVAP